MPKTAARALLALVALPIATLPIATLAIATLPIATAVAGHLPLGGSGELRCTRASGVNYFIGGDRPVTCVYYRPDGAVEFYTGAFHRLGIDIGPTNALRLSFVAQVPGPIATGALDGSYGGVGAQITAGRGLGTDALIGGASGKATLTPIANEYVTGLNFNAGLGVLDLHYRGMERQRYR